MSSLPGLHLEDFVAWQWNLIVDEAPENNISLGIAELIGVNTGRPNISKEEFAPLVALYEPYREDIERRLDDFDEDNQSWRSYAEYVDCDVPEDVNQQAQAIVAGFKQGKKHE